jgi:hypothetical protein
MRKALKTFRNLLPTNYHMKVYYAPNCRAALGICQILAVESCTHFRQVAPVFITVTLQLNSFLLTLYKSLPELSDVRLISIYVVHWL